MQPRILALVVRDFRSPFRLNVAKQHNTHKKKTCLPDEFFFFSLSSPPPRRLIIREDRCWMPTLSHMARVCRGAAGSILPHTLDGKKRKERVESQSLLLLSIGLWFFFITFCFFQLRWSYFFFFFLFPFFRSPAFVASGPAIFFLRELPPPRGSLLAEQVYSGSLVVRLIHRHRSVGWGGPNTIDERMTPVYSIYWSRALDFPFSCCCWIGKGKEIFTDFIYTDPSCPTGFLFLAISYRVTVYHNKKKTDPSVVTGICAQVGSTFVKLLQRFSIRMRNFLTIPCAYIKGFSSSSSPAAYLFVHVGSCVRWPRYLLTILCFFPDNVAFFFGNNQIEKKQKFHFYATSPCIFH